jgi:hypothetical protein
LDYRTDLVYFKNRVAILKLSQHLHKKCNTNEIYLIEGLLLLLAASMSFTAENMPSKVNQN